MNIADEARDFADRVLGEIPELIHQAVEERRQHACWYEMRADYMSKHAPTRLARWWWNRWRLRHAAKCSANKRLATQCAKARARVTGSPP